MKKESSETEDLTDFYSKLLVTNEVFNIIQEGNLRILNEQSKIMKQEELSADVEYLLNFVNNHKDLVLEIIKEMDNYAFKNLPSLNEKNFISFGGDSSRYFILQDEIKLYPHTLNVAIQMADMLSESEHPNNIIEIGILLALFHDFGKCPQIALNFYEEKNESHEKISANFAKHFLTAYNKRNPKGAISEEVIQTVYQTIYNHHNPVIIQKGIFLTMLIKADRNARDFELRMVKMRRAQDAKI